MRGGILGENLTDFFSKLHGCGRGASPYLLSSLEKVEPRRFSSFLQAFHFASFYENRQSFAGKIVHEFLGVECLGHHHAAFGDFSGH